MSRQNEIPQRLEDLIILFLQKEISPKEMKVLAKWLTQNEAFKQYFDEINKTFQLTVTSGRIAHTKAGDAWKKLSQKIDEKKA